jgi:porin
VIGGWGYSGDKVCIDDPDEGAREYGGYASLEHPFTEHTTGYVRIGLANPQVERLGSYLGGGIVNTRGLLPGHGDSVGLALGIARNGRPYRDARDAEGVATSPAEYALEATWRIPLGRHFVLQPDVQYVIHPDTDPAIDDALVFILRLEASL